MLSAFSQAWASWKTAPGVALLAVVAFAVGIGSATAIFTVINGVLLRPLPYPGSERFVSLYGASTTEPGTFMAMSVPELHDYQQQTTSFDAFGWFRAGRFHLTAPGEPQFVPGAAVTPALARQLGPPLLGQWFADDSERRHLERPVAAPRRRARHHRQRHHARRAPLYRERRHATGVPAADRQLWDGTRRHRRVDSARSVAARREPGQRQYFAYARRKPGVSLEQAQADVRRVAAIVAATDPAAVSVLHGGRGRPARVDEPRASAPRC